MRTKLRQTAPVIKDNPELSSYIQDIAEDLTTVINGGLSLKDNLPLSLYKATITSGVAKEISGAYATIVFCDSPVTKMAWKTLKKGLLSVTITTEAKQAEVILLVIKEVIS